MGRTQTPETKQKISLAIKRLHQEGKLRPGIFSFDADYYEQRRHESRQRLLTDPFDDLSFERKRYRVILEQDGKCARCHLDTWFSTPIVLELDHKNGINDDNTRDNLEMLCPNCHSLTPTWRGRNKPAQNSRSTPVTDDELIAAIQSTTSLRQALLVVGMAAKGGNYRRIKRLAESIRADRHQ